MSGHKDRKPADPSLAQSRRRQGKARCGHGARKRHETTIARALTKPFRQATLSRSCRQRRGLTRMAGALGHGNAAGWVGTCPHRKRGPTKRPLAMGAKHLANCSAVTSRRVRCCRPHDGPVSSFRRRAARSRTLRITARRIVRRRGPYRSATKSLTHPAPGDARDLPKLVPELGEALAPYVLPGSPVFTRDARRAAALMA